MKRIKIVYKGKDGCNHQETIETEEVLQLDMSDSEIPGRLEVSDFDSFLKGVFRTMTAEVAPERVFEYHISDEDVGKKLVIQKEGGLGT